MLLFLLFFIFLFSEGANYDPACPEKRFNIILVLDDSGSVQNGRDVWNDFTLPLAIGFVTEGYFNISDEETKIGVVSYSTEYTGSQTYCPTEEEPLITTIHSLSGDANSIESALNSYVQKSRYSPIGQGILQAESILDSNGEDEDILSIIILLSDGKPTCEVGGSQTTENRELISTVAEALKNRVPQYVLFSVGIGEYDEQSIRDMAYLQEGDSGVYAYYVDHSKLNEGWAYHLNNLANQICTFSIYCKDECTENQKCKLPNYCVCKDGYLEPLCTPICSQGCINGDCTEPEVCTCDPAENWEGDDCSIPICLDTCDETHGSCTVPQTCVCESGWGDEIHCNEPICTTPCEGNTYCSAPDVCSCEDGWEGAPTCDIPICKTGCVNGQCETPTKTPGECFCNDGWEGDLCDIPICKEGCVNGECDNPGECNCVPDTEWQGDLCDDPICDLSCNLTNGNCSVPGGCDCFEGWYDPYCDEPICKKGCVDEHGYCNLPGECICVGLPDWYGDLCQFAVCLDGCNTSNAFCNEPHQCTCNDGWNGTYCNSPICGDPLCVHGYCNKPYDCICYENWQGSSCDEPVCADGCDKTHGYCNVPGECLCNDGYSGVNCDESDCTDGCQHGSCPLAGTCYCDSGWYGPLCNIPYCHSDCKNGDCSTPGGCDCFDGWEGDFCDKPICREGCSTRYGSCESPNTCICVDGWSGDTCKESVCLSGCLNGNCTEPDGCDCFDGWYGTTCTYPKCSTPCGGNATCVNKDVCQCDSGYKGDGYTCVPECNADCPDNAYCCKDNECCCDDGYYGYDPSVQCLPLCYDEDTSISCSYPNGSCIGVDTCECEKGYEKAKCQTWSCFGYDKDLKESCNNGTCISPNVCFCSDGYFGQVCEYEDTSLIAGSVANTITGVVAGVSSSLIVCCLLLILAVCCLTGLVSRNKKL